MSAKETFDVCTCVQNKRFKLVNSKQTWGAVAFSIPILQYRLFVFHVSYTLHSVIHILYGDLTAVIGSVPGCPKDNIMTNINISR